MKPKEEAWRSWRGGDSAPRLPQVQSGTESQIILYNISKLSLPSHPHYIPAFALLIAMIYWAITMCQTMPICILSPRQLHLPQFCAVQQLCHPILWLSYNFKSVHMTTHMIWKSFKALFILQAKIRFSKGPCLLLPPDLSISPSTFPSPCPSSSLSQHTTHTQPFRITCSPPQTPSPLPFYRLSLLPRKPFSPSSNPLSPLSSPPS